MFRRFRIEFGLSDSFLREFHAVAQSTCTLEPVCGTMSRISEISAALRVAAVWSLMNCVNVNDESFSRTIRIS